MLARDKGFSQTNLRPFPRRARLMSEGQNFPKVGEAYRSKRTGKLLTVTAIENDRVYYTVEGFKTIAPLFLPKEKFLHLIGADDADFGASI